MQLYKIIDHSGRALTAGELEESFKLLGEIIEIDDSVLTPFMRWVYHVLDQPAGDRPTLFDEDFWQRWYLD